MERIIKEAKIKELLTGKKQFGTITLIDRKINSDGVECPQIVSQKNFYNPQEIGDLTISIIYQRWQVDF